MIPGHGVFAHGGGEGGNGLKKFPAAVGLGAAGVLLVHFQQALAGVITAQEQKIRLQLRERFHQFFRALRRVDTHQMNVGNE